MLNKNRILFVCLGNICRSPAAEGIFKKLVTDNKKENLYTVDSAGTSGYHDGDLPDSRMREHASKRGYALTSRSRKIDLEDFLDFDYIITMDDSNFNNVLRMAPDLESRNKIYRMIDFCSDDKFDHIPDPYYQGADGFELVLDLLEDSCKTLFLKLEENEI